MIDLNTSVREANLFTDHDTVHMCRLLGVQSPLFCRDPEPYLHTIFTDHHTRFNTASFKDGWHTTPFDQGDTRGH